MTELQETQKGWIALDGKKEVGRCYFFNNLNVTNFSLIWLNFTEIFNIFKSFGSEFQTNFIIVLSHPFLSVIISHFPPHFLP